MEYFFELRNFIENQHKLIGVVIGTLTLLLALVGFLYNVPRIRREVRKLREEQSEATSAISKLTYLRKLSEQGQLGLWSSDANHADISYHDRLEASIPIILLANLKGGVGKTTIAANLAAALSDTGPAGETGTAKRVLAIDLDYQGSLSSLFIGHNDLSKSDIKDVQTRGTRLLDGEHDSDWAQVAAQPLPGRLANLRYLATEYNLADLENRLTLKWLIGDANVDVRFNLFKVLHHPHIQRNYDYIIIDTAPRLTLAFLNGMGAATHLLVPTLLDDLSAQSAGNFLRQYKGLRKRIFPQLELLGVVGSMTFHKEPGRYTEAEQRAKTVLTDQIRRAYAPGDFFLDDCNVRRDRIIRDAAGSSLAYFSEDESDIFTRLASTVIERTRK